MSGLATNSSGSDKAVSVGSFMTFKSASRVTAGMASKATGSERVVETEADEERSDLYCAKADEHESASTATQTGKLGDFIASPAGQAFQVRGIFLFIEPTRPPT